METLKIGVIGGELAQAVSNDLCFDLKAGSIFAIQDAFSGFLLDRQAVDKHPYRETFKFDFPYTLPPRHRVCVDTGLILDFPENVGAILKPRSGLAFKYGIDVLAGVIDPGYRDTIKVILINHNFVPYVIGEGDRVAQLWPVVVPYRFEFTTKDVKAKNTERGKGGFGSTGVK